MNKSLTFRGFFDYFSLFFSAFLQRFFDIPTLFCDVAVKVFKAFDGNRIAVGKTFGVEIVRSVAHRVIVVLKIVVESGDAC